MKATAIKCFIAAFVAVFLGLAAQAQVTYSDTFAAPVNFLTNGVSGTIWSGIYRGSVTSGGDYGYAAPTGIAQTLTALNTTTTNIVVIGGVTNSNVVPALHVVTEGTAFGDGANDDAFMLWKQVNGDFSVTVNLATPVDATAFHTAGLFIRNASANGNPSPNFGENYLKWDQFFGEFGIGAYMRTTTNSIFEQTPIFTTNTYYWLRVTRTAGTNFNFYDSLDGTNWFLETSAVRPDFAGSTLQVGLSDCTFNGPTTQEQTFFSAFSLTESNNIAAATPSPATSLNVVNTNDNFRTSWVPGAGSSGSVVVVWPSTDPYARTAPANGVYYTGNTNFGLGSSLPATNYYVVFAGAGTNVTIGATLPGVTYQVAVYSYSSATTNDITYSSTPLRGSFVGTSHPVSLSVAAPSAPVIASSSRILKVLATMNNGGVQDVSSAAGTVYSSTASNIATAAAGTLRALANGTVTINVTNTSGTNVISASSGPISVTGLAMTHRWSFNDANGSTNAVDSIGGATGTVLGTGFFTGGLGGVLLFDGNSTSVVLPPNLFTNYGAITVEAWYNDATGDAGNLSSADLLNFGSTAASYGDFSATGNGQYLFGPNFQQVATLSVPSQGVEHQLVWTQSGASQSAQLYLDGVLVSSSAGATLTPEIIGPEPVVQIGQSINGFGLLSATFDELRVYNGAIDGLAVAVDNFYGPDSTNTATGAATGMTFTLGENPSTKDDVVQATVTVNFTTVGALNVTTSGHITYTSSDTNIATVDTIGNVTAVNQGTSTITAVGFGFTNSVVLTVVPNLPTLQHRYSFNGNFADSINPGGAFDGVLAGSPGNVNFTNINGSLANNAALLFNNGGSKTGYIQLPQSMLASLNSITLEAWYTENAHLNWARIWDFGNPNTTQYLFYAPDAAGAFLRNAITISGPGGEQQVQVTPLLPVGKEHHVVYTEDGTNHIGSLYLDGVLVNQNPNVTIRPRDMGPTTQDFIGASQFGDPDFQGVIDEFRIYNYPLSAFQVLIDAATGPDTIVNATNVGTLQTVVLTATNMTVGQSQQVVATANYQNVTNVPVSALSSNWTSSNPSAVKVSSSGVLTAVGTGSSTIHATYGGVTGNFTITVSVGVAAPVLAHEYRFWAAANGATTVVDSVNPGNPNLSATLGAAATITNGLAVLPGGGGSYVQLAAGASNVLISPYTNGVTIQTWYTYNNAGRARMWDFGNAADTNYWGITGQSGGGNNLFLYNSNGAGEQALEPMIQAKGMGVQHSYALIFNPINQTINYYIDGFFENSIPMAAAPGDVNIAHLDDATGFLGQAINVADGAPNLNGSYQEFRIWNGALDQLQIETTVALGPTNASLNPGTLNSINLTLNDTNMFVGTIQRPQVSGSYATAGTLDLTAYPGVVLTSGNTNVVVVVSDSTGADTVQAVGTGNTTVQASFGGKISTRTVFVSSPAFALTHRFSFNKDLIDTVGYANARLIGAAALTNGAVSLNGSRSPVTYASLTRGMISGYPQATIEEFATINPGADPGSYLWAFGNTVNAAAANYMFLTPTQLGFAGGVPEFDTPINGSLVGQTVQVVSVIDSAAQTITIYTNGVLANTVNNSAVNLAGVADNFAFISGSLNGNAQLSANVNDLRIYYGAMSSGQVAASFAAGANPETLAITNSGPNEIISWTLSPVTAGYALQSSPGLTPPTFTTVGTTPVTNGTTISVTVPRSGPETVYRLFKPHTEN